MDKATNKRSLRLLSLLAVLALVVAACGGDDGSTDTTAADEATDTTADEGATETTGSEGGSDEEITLSVWSWLPNDHENGPDTYQQIFDNFEEAHPNVTIELTASPYPTFWDSWRNASIAGVGPDVISMYGGATAGGYATSLLPLQDELSPETTENLRFLDSTVSPDNNLYVAPAGAYAYYLLYNQQMLTDAGLDPEAAFSSWDSLLSTCQTLSDAGVVPFASGWSDGYELEGYMYIFMTQLLDQQGFEEFVSGDLPLTDERFQEGMNYIVAMNEAGCFSEESLGMTMYNDAFDEVIAGEAVAFPAGGGDTAVDAEANNGEGSMVAAPFPQVSGSQYEVISDSGPNQGWSVTNWASDTEMAVALVEHIVSAESQMLLYENTELPPNRSDVELESDSPLFADYLGIIDNPANHTTFMAFTDAALAIFQREASNLIAGRTTVDDILETADDAQQRALEELEQ